MIPLIKKEPWKDTREAYQESLEYLKGRQKGYIKSLQLPWKSWNDATTNGLEWHSTTVIGGRPASGKTLIKDQIIREAFKLNPTGDFRVLEFSFEMVGKVSAIREYTSVLSTPSVKKSYKYLCSADGILSDEDFQKCVAHAKEKVKYPVQLVEDQCTVNEFSDIVKAYMEKYHTMVTPEATANNPEPKPVKVYKNTIVSLDHSMLIKKASHEKDSLDTLYNLGLALTNLKRKYPIAFIVLSQLGRNIDTPERNEDGKYGNYILTSDIFGADALLQHADMLIGVNRPGARSIKFFGPERYIITDKDVLVIHFLKCRNGETGLSFFKAEFDRMMITETRTPDTQEKRIKI